MTADPMTIPYAGYSMLQMLRKGGVVRESSSGAKGAVSRLWPSPFEYPQSVGFEQRTSGHLYVTFTYVSPERDLSKPLPIDNPGQHLVVVDGPSSHVVQLALDDPTEWMDNPHGWWESSWRPMIDDFRAEVADGKTLSLNLWAIGEVLAIVPEELLVNLRKAKAVADKERAGLHPTTRDDYSGLTD